MAQYSVAHRCFVQTICNHGTMPVNEAIQCLQKIFEKYGEGEQQQQNVTDQKIREFVDEINRKLIDVDQRLSFVYKDIDDVPQEFLVFCFTNDLGFPPGFIYTEAEANYMKVLIEAIVMSETSNISQIQAINLSTPFASSSQTASKRISQKRAEELIADWVESGYFNSPLEVVELGPRTIGEFGDILRIKFPDNVWSCHLCNQITFKPLQCPEQSCEAALDKRCAQKYLPKKKKCPKCRTAWEFDE